MAASYDVVAIKLDEIEQEMKRIGMWQSTPLPPDAMDFERPFAGDTMAFEQWLQFVFIARVRHIIDTKGKFPGSSQVADQAFKEWKMWGDKENTDTLIEDLRSFDALFT
jgi:uncharacterized protein YqcC (DUF446 family)